MTSNILLPDGATKIATDPDGSSRHYQKVKIGHGVDATFNDLTLATPMPVGWGALNASRGAGGTIPVVVYGRRNVDTTYDFLNDLNSLGYLTTAATMRVKAGGNANDTAAGTGTREVTIYGVDENFALQAEAVATAGALASAATTTTYTRVYHIKDTSNGTIRGTNAAAITVEDGAGAADHLRMPVSTGVGVSGLYTVPAAHTAYPVGLTVTVDAKKAFSFRIITAEGANLTSAPFKPAILYREWLGIEDALLIDNPRAFPPIPALTDIWIQALAIGTTAEITATFSLMIVPN